MPCPRSGFYGAISPRQLPQFSLQVGVIEALTEHVQQVIVFLVYTPSRANAVVTQLRCLVGGVPALHGLDKAFRAVARLVIPEPGCSNDGSAKRRRVLLVLRGEVVLADRFSDMSQGRFGFALRMESV